MSNKRIPYNNDLDEVGTPFEGYGTEKYPYNSNERILPSQFNFPNMFMNFVVIRDITDDTQNDNITY